MCFLLACRIVDTLRYECLELLEVKLITRFINKEAFRVEWHSSIRVLIRAEHITIRFMRFFCIMKLEIALSILFPQPTGSSKISIYIHVYTCLLPHASKQSTSRRAFSLDDSSTTFISNPIPCRFPSLLRQLIVSLTMFSSVARKFSSSRALNLSRVSKRNAAYSCIGASRGCVFTLGFNMCVRIFECMCVHSTA